MSGAASQPIWLDCDPGHDDAFAIMTALHRADLVGVSVVSGNAPVHLCERNALATLQLAGAHDVPVHRGADGPLVREARYAPHIHGESGLDGPELPDVTLEPRPQNAVDAILDASQRVPDLWLVAVGPLTNVALALRHDPGLAERLAGISIMGGNWGPGNVSPVAEFNIWADPDAAAEVFRSGANLVLAGLDLTHQFMIDDARRGAVRALGTRLATFGADLLDFFSHAYARTFGVPAEGPLHDPCAVLAVTDPQLFTTSRRHVEVETASELTRGMTVVDRRAGHARAEPNVTVLETIDDEAAFDLLLGALEGTASTMEATA
ncbi:MAG TPA: nucleoside hydrolase [Trueperaceae bacterium]|nr:nucleoside hydrolase [Trueperaceae bacterium]